MFRKCAGLGVIMIALSACPSIPAGSETPDLDGLVASVHKLAFDLIEQAAGTEARKAAAVSAATVAADVVILESSGKIPTKVKLDVGQSSVRLASSVDDIAVIGIAVAADTSGLLRSAANAFKSMELSSGGNKNKGNYNKDLFGGVACVAASAAKTVKTQIKLKGAKSQPAGTGAVYAAIVVPVAAAGIPAAAICQAVDDLINGFLRVGSAPTE